MAGQCERHEDGHGHSPCGHQEGRCDADTDRYRYAYRDPLVRSEVRSGDRDRHGHCERRPGTDVHPDQVVRVFSLSPRGCQPVGRLTVKIAPEAPFAAVSVPPIRATRRAAIDRPRPVPTGRV